MPSILETFSRFAVVPAIVLDDASHAAALADALVAGGLPLAEITLRTPAAFDAIKIMAQDSSMLVGAGTVMNRAQAEKAIEAGAQFIVSPGMSEDLIRYCQERKILIVPGAVTATEVMLAANLGLDCVKFFPCEASGGLPVLKALQGPFPKMRFMPTGGINVETLPRYLKFSPVLAVGGTWMVRSEWLRSGNFDLVEEACQQTMSVVAMSKLNS
jgi:2-dehydro-3-deoxyphosphogluconate aldolase/(4S)-4-hydroxy-2-oxoglutarate aldolase